MRRWCLPNLLKIRMSWTCAFLYYCFIDKSMRQQRIKCFIKKYSTNNHGFNRLSTKSSQPYYEISFAWLELERGEPVSRDYCTTGKSGIVRRMMMMMMMALLMMMMYISNFVTWEAWQMMMMLIRTNFGKKRKRRDTKKRDGRIGDLLVVRRRCWFATSFISR